VKALLLSERQAGPAVGFFFAFWIGRDPYARQTEDDTRVGLPSQGFAVAGDAQGARIGGSHVLDRYFRDRDTKPLCDQAAQRCIGAAFRETARTRVFSAGRPLREVRFPRRYRATIWARASRQGETIRPDAPGPTALRSITTQNRRNIG
jgi:hypothetical protein